VGDVVAALHAADIAVFVVSAVEGVEVQTEIAWKLAEARGIPRAIFLNKLDRERASFSRTLDELKDKFGAGVAPLQLPIGDEAEFHGVVELLDAHAVHYVDGTATEGPIPPEMELEEHSIHDALVEGIVVGDDDLMERYLADETIPVAELAHALADGVASGAVFPVLCGSATKLIGVDRLAQFITEEGPAPSTDAGDGPPVAFVFKTIVDPYVGHVNLFKVLQGPMKADATLVNGRTMHEERLHHHRLRSRRGEAPDPRRAAGGGRSRACPRRSSTWP
jgi:elongation factor G